MEGRVCAMGLSIRIEMVLVVVDVERCWTLLFVKGEKWKAGRCEDVTEEERWQLLRRYIVVILGRPAMK